MPVSSRWTCTEFRPAARRPPALYIQQHFEAKHTGPCSCNLHQQVSWEAACGLHSVALAAWAGGVLAPPSSAASLPAPVPPMHPQMVPPGQYLLWVHWCTIQMLHAAATPAMQPILWPHRSVLPTGGIGPVLPDFSPQPHGNPRGSLRTDLAVYDIIFFIALGLSMEVRCCCDACAKGMPVLHAQLPLPLACWLGTSMPPAAHPTRAASLRLLPLPPWHNAVAQNPAGLARVSAGGLCATGASARANTGWADYGVRRSTHVHGTQLLT